MPLQPINIEDQETKGGHEKQAAISAHPEKDSTMCHGQCPPLTASGPKGEVLWWLLRTWLDRVKILDVRHSDRRAPQDIRRLGKKKTRIMQLSENARSPPTPALSRSFPWKPHLHSGPAEHRWQCCPACQNKCEDSFWGFFFFQHFINITEAVIWELWEVPREIPGCRVTQALILLTLKPCLVSGHP